MSQFPMRCLSLGRSAPPEVREAAAFADVMLSDALRGACASGGIKRLVILSTCHRVELYAELDGGADHARAVLVEWLSRMRCIPAGVLMQSARYMDGDDAVRHLYRVALGLDSALIGEAEIISQVRMALRESIAEHAASPALKAAFRGAADTAELAQRAIWRRFRRADIGSIAVEAIVAHRGGISGLKAVVVGAGHAGRLAARALYRAGSNVVVLNRTPLKPESFVRRRGMVSGPLTDLGVEASNADILVAATSAKEFLVTAPALAGRRKVMSRALSVVDLATPRNVDPVVTGLPGVTLIPLHELHALVQAVHAERSTAVPEVERLMADRAALVLSRSWERPKGFWGSRQTLSTQRVES